MNHARRQQYRRVSRAGRLALTSVPAAILGLYLLAAGAAVPGAALLVLAIMLGLRARHWLSEPALRTRSSAPSIRFAVTDGKCVIQSRGQAEGTSTRW